MCRRCLSSSIAIGQVRASEQQQQTTNDLDPQAQNTSISHLGRSWIKSRKERGAIEIATATTFQRASDSKRQGKIPSPRWKDVENGSGMFCVLS